MEIKNNNSPAQGGFTLVEVMVATGVGLLSMVILVVLTVSASRSFAYISEKTIIQASERTLSAQLSRDARQASKVVQASTNLVAFDLDGQIVTYSHDADNRRITRSVGEKLETILENCDTFQVQLFQKNPITGAYEAFPLTLLPGEAKLVQVAWTCSRPVFSSYRTTCSSQTAKLVLRNG